MSNTGKGRWWWNALGMLGVVAAGAVLVGGWMVLKGHSAADTGPTRKPPEVVAVTIEPVAARPLQRYVRVVGSLHGRDEVAISPKVDGRIVKIRHDVGDVVKPGEVLLEIDPIDYQLAVAEARRSLELSLSRLGLKEPPDKTFDVATLPMVIKALAQERNASTRWERVRRLVSGGASAEERDQAETDFKVAQANSRQAVLEAESTLAEARHRQAALDTALQRLKDTRILVPESTADEYVVCQREVTEGEMVRETPGGSTMLFRLIVDRPLKLKVTVPDRHRGEVKMGQQAQLEVEAFPGQKFIGEVSRINPSVDRTSRTFQVEILVPNTDRRLSSGSFAKVGIQTSQGATALTVPEEAIVRFAGVTKVFIVQDNQAREVQVRTGLSVDVSEDGRTRTWVEVEGKVPMGAKVVTSGQTQLADQTPIRVRDSEAKPVNSERGGR